MANPRGTFDETQVPLGWFDETAQAAGWFDGDLLDASSGAPTAARHLAHLLPALGAVALGLFAHAAPAAPKHGLHAFRAPAAAAAAQSPVSIGSGELVFVESGDKATRVDHASRLLVYRTSAQTVGQPWQAMFPQAKLRTATQFFEPGLVAIPEARVTFQGVPVVAQPAQPWFMLQSAVRAPGAVWDNWQGPQVGQVSLFEFISQPAPAGRALPLVTRAPVQAWAEDAAPVRAQWSLHEYRFGYQTVGQPYSLLSYISRPQGQPLAEEPQHPRTKHEALHQYRPGYQTVGQSWLMRQGSRPPSEFTIDRFFGVLDGAHLLSQAGTESAAPSSQPIMRLPRAAQQFDWSDAWRATGGRSLDPFRQVAVAQPQAFGIDSVDLNSKDWDAPWRASSKHDLQPFRQYTTAAQPTQPMVLLSGQPKLTHARPAAEALHVVGIGSVVSRAAAVVAAPGQPFSLLRAPPLPPWTVFEPTLVSMPHAAVAFQSAEDATPPDVVEVSPFAESFFTLNESLWSPDDFRRTQHSLLPFRQITTTSSVGQPWQMLWKRTIPHQTLTGDSFIAVLETSQLVGQNLSIPPVEEQAPPVAFGFESVDLNSPVWQEPWRFSVNHAIQPFRQYAPATALPGQPFSLLRAPRLPSWTTFEPALVSMPVAAVVPTSSLYIEPSGTPQLAPFAQSFITLNEHEWQYQWRYSRTHALQPFRQYAASAPPCVFAVEGLDLNAPVWTQSDIRHPKHALQAFRQYGPAVPAQSFSITSWKSQTMRVDFERDFRVPQYSLYPFRVGLYVVPISYPAQGVGGFHANMGTFMRR